MSAPREPNNGTEDNEVHPLDESLGDIHECAISLEFCGYREWAARLAAAHEKIQTYLINLPAEGRS